ncbi:hypothetical protein ACOSQ4_013316 [Xanthoceras sorbifolium]
MNGRRERRTVAERGVVVRPRRRHRQSLFVVAGGGSGWSVADFPIIFDVGLKSVGERHRSLFAMAEGNDFVAQTRRVRGEASRYG